MAGDVGRAKKSIPVLSAAPPDAGHPEGEEAEDRVNREFNNSADDRFPPVSADSVKSECAADGQQRHGKSDHGCQGQGIVDEPWKSREKMCVCHTGNAGKDQRVADQCLERHLHALRQRVFRSGVPDQCGDRHDIDDGNGDTDEYAEQAHAIRPLGIEDNGHADVGVEPVAAL